MVAPQVSNFGMVTDIREQKRNQFCSGNENSNVWFFREMIPEGKVVEVYLNIEGITERKDKRVSAQINCVCHRDVGGSVVLDGNEIIFKKNDIGAKFTVTEYAGFYGSVPELWIYNRNHSILGTPIGFPMYWTWTAEIRTREYRAEEHTGYPRLQMTIVGMADAKKSGWAGLKDGINYVLVPTSYTNINNVKNTLVEEWNFTAYKRIGTMFVSDRLALRAQLYGNGASWTYPGNSQWFFKWASRTGDYGTGTGMSSTFASMSYSITRAHGLRRNCLANQRATHKNGQPVTFLWQRYDVFGFRDYQPPGPRR